jgi:LmbE family N-acetylglucosaminyl deacetylase
MADANARAAAALLAALRPQAAEGAAEPPPTMVVVAHPDDETVGAGSRLPRLARAQFVYVTDGAPPGGSDAAALGLTTTEYGYLRRRELEAALALCGIPSTQVLHLPCPDQQAPYRLVELSRTLATLFLQFRPAAVLTHPYEGGHPDHDATALAVRAAVQLLRRDGQGAPAVLEMTSYHQGPGGIRTGTFLAPGEDDPVTVRLTPQEIRFKRALFDCFATQRKTLAYFPLDVERFRRSPACDFGAAPHDGPLFYEGFDWGITGAQFRALAADALAELKLETRL